ncbi:AAA family ATPase [Desulfobacula sp.]|uniref:ATP-binding protein n=1 Tax=Desulfobacula sp. TaxID=2593537 RepID=UPI0025C389B4|nr:AAA family ATPase [Desulfobacula sp.]MBC2704800.1 ATP-binding protein [Desulfobacula sp.]
MIRFASAQLDSWLAEKKRKPLVIRGARQVGKTWIVRDLSKRNGLKLIELNFERNPALADLFTSNNPKEILKNLEIEFETLIDPDASLLFLDEIQAAPEIFARLRWFKEDLGNIPLIAAGSLLEFALKEYQYSMPVGRITYFFLEPFSFFEFLLVTGNEFLLKKLETFSLNDTIPESIHKKCLGLYHDYCLVGGMPESLQKWADTKNLNDCIKIQQDLLSTFRDDFYKYGGQFDPGLLFKLFISVSKQLGNKFVYKRVDPLAKSLLIKKSLSMLSQARIFTKIMHTSGNGLPLGAESNENFFKMLLIDIGLVSVQLGLSQMTQSKADRMTFLNKGGLSEQFVGQQIRSSQAPLTDPALFYWQRTGGRQGETDYIIQHGNCVVPVEIKSGTAGSMKSLHQFMADKKLDLAVRFNSNLPSTEKINVKTTKGDSISYTLISIPLYLAQQTNNLLTEFV